MSHDPDRVILAHARRAALTADAPLLLAVSGGLDSMSLLHAMASVARDRIAAVATFDHGTGEFAARAVAHVVREARQRRIPVVMGTIGGGESRSGGMEAMWRAARYRFLRATAVELGARVATAHTRDDQIETVLMRVLRGSGARGLAALEAQGDILRPFVDISRAVLAQYACAQRVTWVEDPSNANLVYLRNRVRRELLPALRRVDASIDDTLLAVGRASAAWRRELDGIVELALRPTQFGHSSLVVALTELTGYDRDSLSVLWGALAGRVGLSLDRRGTHRCATFTLQSPRRGAIPLSGGWQLEARRGELVLHRRGELVVKDSALPLEGDVIWGDFHFSVSRTEPDDDGWSAMFPENGRAVVRHWRPGDRLAPAGGHGPRRVKRYLSDAGVVGSARAEWPVVEVDDEVVWIPGIRRSDTATVRSGGPARHYVCERSLG